MNRNLLLTALVAGLLPVAAVSQVSPAPPASSGPAPQATQQSAPAPVKPQAIPAKVALISFEQAVIATNEGQRAVEDIKKKYEPKKNQIDALSTEIDSLEKQLQAAPATLPEEERASRVRTIDAKKKQLNLDAEGAQTDYNADLQKSYGAVAAKVNVSMQNYAKQNGFTLVLDVSNQQSAVMWADTQTDITEAVITAYNTSSGITAPAPSAPSSTRKPAASPSATPRSTTPKPPTK